MKLSKIFVLDQKDLEEKTEELLKFEETVKDFKPSVIFHDFKRIRYSTTDCSYILDYMKKDGEYQWVLAEQEAYEVKWYDRDLNEKAEGIINNLLDPTTCLFNLKEKEYSLEKDNVKKLLEKYAVKLSEKPKQVKDEKHGLGSATFYRKGTMIIELREFEKLDLYNNPQII